MQFEVLARSDSRQVALRSVLPLVDEHAPRTWIQIAVEGTWEGHHAGSFEFTRNVFASIIANFEGQTNPVPLTYEHPKYAGDGSPIRAAGWIQKLKVRGDQLWAFVEFNPAAAQMVKDGEYRFCSVVVAFESSCRKTGEDIGPELYEVGLTNVPFLDGMTPIQLSRAGHGAKSRKVHAMSVIEILKQAIKDLPEDATAEQVTAYIEGESAKQAAVEGASEAPPEEPAEEEAPEADLSAAPTGDDEEPPLAASDAPEGDAVALADEMPAPEEGAEEEAAQADAASAVAGIAAEAGVDDISVIAFLQENPGAVAAMMAGTPEDGTLAEDVVADEAAMSRDVGKARVAALSKQVADRDEAVTKLSARVAELEAGKHERRIDDAIKAGHILPAAREKMVTLSKDAPHLLDDWLNDAEKTPAVPTGSVVSRGAPGAGGELSKSDEIASLSDAQRVTYRALMSTGHRDHAYCLNAARKGSTAN